MTMRQEDECTAALLKIILLPASLQLKGVAISLNKIYKVGEQDEKWKRGNKQILPRGLLKMDKA